MKYNKIVMIMINFSNDSLTIKDGEVVKGVIDKTAFGSEDGELVKVLDKEVGREETFKIIKKAFNLGKNYISDRGITISVNDLDLNDNIF